jgi:PKD repeat protein
MTRRRRASLLALGSIAGVALGTVAMVVAAPPAFARECTFNHWPPETFVKLGEEAAGIIEPAQAGDSFSGTIDWGDGATTPVTINRRHGHRYAKAGTYTVTQTGNGVIAGTEPCSNSGTFVTTVTVYEVQARFSLRKGTDGPRRSVSVDGSASLPTGQISSYEWSFGDGGTASGPTASHTFDAPGTYEVGLLVIDSHSNTDATTKPVTVGNLSQVQLGDVPAKPKLDPNEFALAGTEAGSGGEDDGGGGGINPIVFAGILAAVAAGLAGWMTLLWAHRSANAEQKKQLEAAIAERAARDRAEHEAVEAAERSKKETDRLRDEAYRIAMEKYAESQGTAPAPQEDHRIEVPQEVVDQFTEGAGKAFLPGPARTTVDYAQNLGENMQGIATPYDEVDAQIKARAEELVRQGQPQVVAEQMAADEYNQGSNQRSADALRDSVRATTDAAAETAEQKAESTVVKKVVKKFIPRSWKN